MAKKKPRESGAGTGMSVTGEDFPSRCTRHYGIPSRCANQDRAIGTPDWVLVSKQALTQFLQSTFTQEIGIAHASFGDFDNFVDDHSIGEIVFEPKAFASHFERHVQNPLGFGFDVSGA
jgi:hypothetical protein